MKVKINIPEAIGIFNKIEKQPERPFEMTRTDIRESVGGYPFGLMNIELTNFLLRASYERKNNKNNHYYGSYGLGFTIIGIDKVNVKVLRDGEEDDSYSLLTFIYLYLFKNGDALEIKSKEKVHKNLPFFKLQAFDNFTQIT